MMMKRNSMLMEWDDVVDVVLAAADFSLRVYGCLIISSIFVAAFTASALIIFFVCIFPWLK